jgi:aspartate racemase
MKTIGMIGGTSWVSTIDYYRYINTMTNERLGRLNSAKIILYSVNFEEMKQLADAGRWDKFGEILSDAAHRLELAGAECLLLCANTMHVSADTVQNRIGIPLIHIADVTAKEIVKQNITKVALLGTKFTMEKDFFKSRLSNFGITAQIPGDAERQFIHDSIFGELGKGIFTAETKKKFVDIMNKMKSGGNTGVVLACTEIPMLITPAECPMPAFDTTLIHAAAAVEFSLH